MSPLVMLIILVVSAVIIAKYYSGTPTSDQKKSTSAAVKEREQIPEPAPTPIVEPVSPMEKYLRVGHYGLIAVLLAIVAYEFYSAYYQ